MKIRKRLKTKAHAMTMAAAVWLFFSLIGLAMIVVGILDRDYTMCALGVLAWIIQFILIHWAVQYWRHEKETEVDYYQTDLDVG